MVVGAEALLRWHHDGELLLPDRFLAVAEQTLLIRPLGDWVLRTACAQAMAWQERFGSLPRLGEPLRPPARRSRASSSRSRALLDAQRPAAAPPRAGDHREARR